MENTTDLCPPIAVHLNLSFKVNVRVLMCNFFLLKFVGDTAFFLLEGPEFLATTLTYFRRKGAVK